jgi:CelD/BcsL family acetyltransferase involved in cellulose biosynthesis
LRIILHREIPDDIDLGHQWNELVMRMERPEVFYTYEWALAVSRVYRASMTPLLVLAYEKDSLVGVVALATSHARSETFFLGSTTSDYCDFISLPDRRRELVDLVFGELRRLKASAFVVANLPSDSATSHALVAAAPMHSHATFSRPAFQCARIVLASSMDRQKVKASVVGRKTLRSSLRSLENFGPVSIDHLKSQGSLATALPEFMQAHIARFAASGRTSNLADPQRQAFLAELAELLSTRGWMVLTRLLVGDQAVAWNYGFQFAGSWFYYQPTFDNAWRQYSPGFCLLSKIVEAACDNPAIQLVDLGLGAEGYKQRFATSVRQTLDITATTSTVRHVKAIVRYRAASAVKSSPRLEHCVRRLLGRASAGAVQA